MRKEDTKNRILDAALTLFSIHGYDAVSVGEIAQAVGIKAPSLYNHYASKQAIFDAILCEASAKYETETEAMSIHITDAAADTTLFAAIDKDGLVCKVCALFHRVLHDETLGRFRRMLTIEQFRTPELAALYTGRFVNRMTDYHRGLFRRLIDAGVLIDADPALLALAYVSPILVLLGICDRQPELEESCIEKLRAHVQLFYETYNRNQRGKEQQCNITKKHN